jgi:hypothetical protein
MHSRHRVLEILVMIIALGFWVYLTFAVTLFSSRNGFWDLGAGGWFMILLLPTVVMLYLAHTALSQRPINRARLMFSGLILLGLIGLVIAGDHAAKNERNRFRLARCCANIKMLSLALLMYADDHQDRLPPADSWVGATLTDPHVKLNTFKCPLDKAPGRANRSSYALNAELGGKLLSAIADPADTPLLYEIPHPEKNPRGNPAQAGSAGRHGEKYVITYADGRAAIFDSKEKYRSP